MVCNRTAEGQRGAMVAIEAVEVTRCQRGAPEKGRPAALEEGQWNCRNAQRGLHDDNGSETGSIDVVEGR